MWMVSGPTLYVLAESDEELDAIFGDLKQPSKRNMTVFINFGTSKKMLTFRMHIAGTLVFENAKNLRISRRFLISVICGGLV